MNIDWLHVGLRDVKSGDYVKVVSGDETIIGSFAIAEAGWIKIQRAGSWLCGVRQTGAKIYREREHPTAPTDFGLYRLSNGMVVELDGMGWRSPNHMQYMDSYVRESYSFQRLMPVEPGPPCQCSRCRTSSKSGTESDG